MRILSITAASRLAERCVRVAAHPLPLDDAVAALVSLDVDIERAQAGVRLALTVGRLEAFKDERDRACLRIPLSRAGRRVRHFPEREPRQRSRPARNGSEQPPRKNQTARASE